MIDAGTIKRYLLAVVAIAMAVIAIAAVPASALTQQSGSVGVEGTIPGAAPSQAPTISVPKNGQGFSTLPVNVAGLCQSGLLVEIFKNNVFAGSVQCSVGSYSVPIDLFSGTNDLIARQYDALNQASPDSATVTVTFNNALPGTGSLVSITTQYSKRGADPGSVLTWPITVSGGNAPYAVSVDWGDKTAPELISLPGAGNFNIQHTYALAGTYNVTIEVTDLNGNSAFLQVVGVGNGATQQGATASGSNTSGNSSTKPQKVVVWWPYIVLFLLAISTFWLGEQHQLEVIRGRLRRGERPFK